MTEIIVVLVVIGLMLVFLTFQIYYINGRMITILKGNVKDLRTKQSENKREIKDLKASIWFINNPEIFKYEDKVIITYDQSIEKGKVLGYWKGTVKGSRYHKSPTGWRLIYDVDNGKRICACHNEYIHSISEECTLKEIGYKENI